MDLSRPHCGLNPNCSLTKWRSTSYGGRVGSRTFSRLCRLMVASHSTVMSLGWTWKVLATLTS